MTDAELLDRFLARGDEAAERAFAELVERHGAAVMRVCRDVLGDPHEAQDASQAAFLVLARKARSIRDPRSLGPWLHGVALRVSRRARAEAMRRGEAERRGAEAMVERARRGRAAAGSPHCPELHEEIDRLPDKYRLPIVLCYLQGHTQEKAARALGWPYGTVQVRLHRGRQKLRDRLARRGVGPIGVLGLGTIGTLAESSAATVPPGWARSTAGAAIRFAAPPTTRLAGSPSATMPRRWLRIPVVALATLGLAVAVIYPATPGTTAGKPGRPAAGPIVAEAGEARGDAARPAPGTSPIVGEPEVADAALGGASPAAAIPVGRGVGPTEGAIPANRPAVRSPASSLPPTRGIGFEAGRLASRPTDDELRDRLRGLGRPSGRELFERAWTPNDPRSRGGDGLGPVFNARSCVDCHDLGGPGGAGSSARNIEIATADGEDPGGFGFSYAFRMDFAAGQFSYQMASGPPPASRRASPDPNLLASIHPGFREARSLVLHRFGTDRAYQVWRESVPGPHGSITVRTSQRNPTPLFGTGLIDRIPDGAIVAASTRRFPGSAQVKGRVGRTKAGRVGRFGWKAQTATLEEFVLFAAATEMGLEVAGHPQADDPRLPGLGAPGPDLGPDECVALVAFVRGLPSPAVRDPGDAREAAAIRAGEKTFGTIGCAGCHLPNLGDVEGIYSDLLLHDMSPRLGDIGNYAVFVAQPAADGAEAADGPRGEGGGASPREWRTPPLWGLRDSAPYLHDGRAASVAQAIALHGGQGAPSAERFSQLPPRRKQQLEAFLTSLAAPPRDVVQGRPE